MKRIAVRVTAPCFIDAGYRQPGQVFMVPEHLLERPDRLPSCLQRVTAEHRAAREEFVEVAV